MGEFTDKLKGLSGAIGALDDEFNKFGPIARDLDTLHNQLDETHGFISKCASRRGDVEDLAREAEDLIKSGIAPNPREMKDTVSNLMKQLDKLDSKGHGREKEVDSMIGKVSAFYDQFDKLMNDITSVIAEEKSFGAVGGDSAAIKAQQVILNSRKFTNIHENSEKNIFCFLEILNSKMRFISLIRNNSNNSKRELLMLLVKKLTKPTVEAKDLSNQRPLVSILALWRKIWKK